MRNGSEEATQAVWANKSHRLPAIARLNQAFASAPGFAGTWSQLEKRTSPRGLVRKEQLPPNILEEHHEPSCDSRFRSNWPVNIAHRSSGQPRHPSRDLGYQGPFDSRGTLRGRHELWSLERTSQFGQ